MVLPVWDLEVIRGVGGSVAAARQCTNGLYDRMEGGGGGRQQPGHGGGGG